ncbi:Mercuric reductase [Piscirickettsia salmonis]|uniref:dihydrolipoyl dehydrogenase family protein n=1 Tax=Piscirickettsia salmonis TaxID=1238 RepID=UPI0012BA577A|nr:FAD-dependent oxidoreductase [Piscirickettsia salmonis]QGP56556.1 Mercuric reductase [Piscirickettsia salmonis]QGP66120.1 Mercuric reductase [Piscirickettsia salmonis]
MSQTHKTDLCIIGAGSGGLSVASAAVQMGAQVTLIEQDKMGGDCLNYGCVPSKALIAAAKHIKLISDSAAFGIRVPNFTIDHQALHGHIHERISHIAPHDSIERFESLGVNVILGTAQFTSPKLLQVGNITIQARRFIIASGSKASIPNIPGLESTPYFTNETIFNLTHAPDHLAVIGGGPIGLEIACAYAYLGVKVTLITRSYILPKEDQKLVDIVRNNLKNKNHLEILEKININNITDKNNNNILINAENQSIQASHLLIATGRTPTLNTLNLSAADIHYTDKGITVDNRLRTTNKKIYAIGDVIGKEQFTHAANYHAGIVIRNILFHLPAKATALIPRITYTLPEIGYIGLTEQQAKEQYGSDKIQCLNWPFKRNDRAITDRQTTGLTKVIVNSKGKILGAGIVHPHASDLLTPWLLAINNNLNIKHIAGLIHPYPTLGEANKYAAASFYTPKLFSNKIKFIVKILMKLNRC